MRLDNKVALITGAASGIGAATARRFVAENAKVVVADVLERDGRAVVDELNDVRPGSSLFCGLDITDEDGWGRCVETAVEAFGRVDILVNNAGLSGTADDLLDVALWNRLLSVNSTGAFLGTAAVVGPMQRDGGGSIVNVSSVAAFVGHPKMHVGYSASKSAVLALAKATAVQWGKSGIRCNAVLPGWLPPMRSASTLGGGLRDSALAALPLGRVGTVEEVANAILFLASDEASYITGTALFVDGGFLAT